MDTEKQMLQMLQTSTRYARGLHAAAFFVCSFALIGSSLAAGSSTCRALFQRSAFVEASACFVKTADALGASAKLSQEKRTKKGRLLRNASTALDKAAKQETKISVKAHLRWQGIQVLKRYIDERLYESLERKKEAQLMQHQLRAAIGYSMVTLVVRKGATLSIKGYHFSHSSKGSWSKRIRPGRYQIKVTAPGVQPLQQELHVLPNQTRVVQLRFPKKALVARSVPQPRQHPGHASRRTLGFALLIGGGVLALGGGVMVGIVLAAHGKVEALETTFIEEPGEFEVGDTQDQGDAQALRDDLAPWAFVLAGIGLAAVGTGALIVALSPVASPPPQPAPTAGRTLLLSAQ